MTTTDWMQYVPDYSIVPPGYYIDQHHITLPIVIDPNMPEDIIYTTTAATTATTTITIPFYTQPGISSRTANVPSLTLIFNKAHFTGFLRTHLSGKYLRFKNILEGTERIIKKEEAMKFAWQFFQSMGTPNYKSHEDLHYKDDEWELSFERAITSEQLLEEITLDS